jgi:HAD superfamily hydrolase (TIGR01458 family)
VGFTVSRLTTAEREREREMRKQFRGVLIDLDGVLRIGSKASRGAARALEKLRENDVEFRIVTNTTTETTSSIVQSLEDIGFSKGLLDSSSIFSAPAAANVICEEDDVTLLSHPSIRSEFFSCNLVESDNRRRDRSHVLVVGDAMEGFDRKSLNKAFRVVLDAKSTYAKGSSVLALGGGKYYNEGGRLSLDAYPFAEMIARAADVPIHVCGKPSKSTFEAASKSMSMSLDDVVMIGDDWRVDALGSVEAGCSRSILVKTGKYIQGDDTRLLESPKAQDRSHVEPDFAAAVEFILSS